MRFAGYGHGCVEWITTRPRCTPLSSQTSRRTASSTLSAGSKKPASVLYQYAGQRFWRPSRMRFPSALTTAMMTVGSVRGKQRLEMPVRVAQGGRSLEDAASTAAATSLGGQVRLKPALTERVL